MLEDITCEKFTYKTRVLQLEKSIETGFGITVRKEITLVNTDLLKLDYVIMQVGVTKLLKDNSEKIEDTEYYIELIKKIQKIMDKMSEAQEVKGVSEIQNAI